MTETDEPKHTETQSLWEQLWIAVPRLLIMISALTVMYAMLTWLTGGIRPQSQIDVDSLKAQVSDIKSGLAVCNSRFDALPRSSDFANDEAHLSRLDAVFEGLRDRMTAAEYEIRENTSSMHDLLSGSKTPVRTPR